MKFNENSMKIQFQFNEIRFEFNEIHSMRKASWVEHPGTRQSFSRHFSQQNGGKASKSCRFAG